MNWFKTILVNTNANISLQPETSIEPFRNLCRFKTIFIIRDNINFELIIISVQIQLPMDNLCLLSIYLNNLVIWVFAVYGIKYSLVEVTNLNLIYYNLIEKLLLCLHS